MTSNVDFGLQVRSKAGHTMLPLHANAPGSDENKYAKGKGQESGSFELSKSGDMIAGLSLKNISSKDVAALMRNPFQVYLCFVMAVSIVYYLLGGNLMLAQGDELLGYPSTILETLGLLVLRHKIKSQASVKGISGMTMAMYGLVFVSRQYLLMPEMSWYFMDAWAVEVLRLPSIMIVFDSLRDIFKTHKSTYQEELDVLRMKYIVPVCIGLAFVIHPKLPEGEWQSFVFASYAYLDVGALLPQVVMMARSVGKVEAPIAHFVAATAFRWGIDLWSWYFNLDLGPQGWYKGINVAGLLIVATHILALLLVADFMYFYIKARISGSKLTDDLEVDV